ncbi:efflux RND transporter permease subunit [Oceanococcus atlanticus]|nr:efflux RND transporter permease subunit [Oceanococcus atlanticus]
MSSPTHGMIAWMARNGVTANLLMIVMVFGGFYASTQIKKEVFPEFTLDFVTVSASYPGASPEDVEQGIVLPIEEALEGVVGIKEINATASEGSGSVVAELQEDANASEVLQDIQQVVSRIQTFPADAEQPQVELAKRVRDVLDILIYGQTSEWQLRELAETVRDQLLASPGITQVELQGARDYRIHVDVSSAQLQAFGLSLPALSQRVAAAAQDASGGSVDSSSGEILVRVNERRDWAREFAALPVITAADGAVVTLGEIAAVTEGFDDTQENWAMFDGQRAIGIEVFRIGDQTPTSVSDAVHDALAPIQASLPDGVSVVVLDDDADIYRQRLALLLKNAFLGLILVFTLLALFLEFKLAFWVTMGIPISFLGALLFMPGMAVSINMISMFAFIISLGIVVDDAVVAGENIYEYRQRGLSFLEAAIQGARDIAVPITFSVLTNIVAFLPLLFVPGFMGKVWGVIPLVVCTVFAISLIEALFVLPAHLAHSKPLARESRMRGWQQSFSSGFSAWVERIYQPLVERAVSHRYLTLSIGLGALMIVMSYAMSGRMGFEMMPSVEGDRAEATVVLPEGTPPERVIAAEQALRAAAQEVIDGNGGDRLSHGIYTRVQPSQVRAQVYLTEPGVRPISTAEFARQWREATPGLPDARYIRYASTGRGPGGGPGLSLELTHRDKAILDEASARFGNALREFPQVSDVDDGVRPGKDQFNVRLSDAGRSLGLTAQDVGQQIRAAFYGNEVVRQLRGRSEVRVLVRLPESERNSESAVGDLLIRTPAGTYVPLNLVADLERDQAEGRIVRRNGRRSMEVSANVEPDSEAPQVLAAVQAQTVPQLITDYPGLNIGLSGRQQDMQESLDALGTGFLIALALIYVLLAIPFSSYLQPVLVMLAIPFGIFGAIIGHWMMGYSMSLISIMGVIALSGVVVNDSLVMVHYANQRCAAGDTPFEAIVKSGARRFRPILLTTLSTFGGLAPMIFETSRQARFMIPMAISVGYGILFATAITLILVPCLYMVIEDLRAAGRRVAQRFALAFD